MRQSASVSTLASRLAFLSAAVFAAMMAVMIVGRVTQPGIEAFDVPAAYTSRLLAWDRVLRLLLTLDGIFIAAYVGMALAVARSPRIEHRWLVPVLVGGSILAGLLDIIENQHLLTLLASARAELPIEAESLRWQGTLSGTKWLVGHVVFFLLGLAMQARGWERWLKASLVFVQLPVGVAVWTLDEVPAIALLRALLLGSGFVLIGLWVRGGSQRGAPATVPPAPVFG